MINGSYSLEGKVAIVTGGTRGIGRAVSIVLARAGANLIVNYLSNEKTAEETVKLVGEVGCKIVLVRGDAAKAETAQQAVDDAMERFGKIDILVNNAGKTADNLLVRMTDEEWDSVIETNLRSTFLFTRAALRPMLRQRSGPHHQHHQRRRPRRQRRAGELLGGQGGARSASRARWRARSPAAASRSTPWRPASSRRA